MKRLRERIRDVTDGLKSDEWILLADLRARLKGTKPTRTRLTKTVRDMVSCCELERDDAPEPRVRGTRYVYRSGPQRIVGQFERVGKGQKVKTGFMALARLKKENPEEWARLTDGGRL